MNIQERKRYNLTIFVLYAAFFFPYGGLGLWMYLDDASPFGMILSILIPGLMGGWLVARVIGGVWLGCKFVSRQSKTFIIPACVLAPFTFFAFFNVGIFAAVPYAVYNVIIIRRGAFAETEKTPAKHSTALKPILTFAHTLLEQTLQPGDIAVDCTMGNGHGTLFLANLVGKKGHVFAFDIQQSALESTQKLLAQYDILGRDIHIASLYTGRNQGITLINDSHTNLANHIPVEACRNIKAAVFNLGYLPGSDKSICTAPNSTIQTIETLIPMLLPGGIIVLIVYPGHEEGQAEAAQVLDYCKNLPHHIANVIEYKILNNPNKPPFVIAIEKL